MLRLIPFDSNIIETNNITIISINDISASLIRKSVPVKGYREI